ncbi:YL1 nuclear [Penicillium verhagenii]|uniref:YL1 nuclear n=1 Tax=Penicillium verhagenii TaxID=1562060 RepID=UPI002544EF7C|nr:YL1 nuclear [Penicillium verhagenii]KAJ5934497.1 YL1 nuclear [Penicillium verhagenii]
MAELLETDPDSEMVSSAEEEEEAEVLPESLVSGRAKRSTAGLHMSALIDAAADDDLTLLFEEVEDDNDFAVDDGADEEDMGLDSSSDDDEDQGPNANDDDEGEKELQKTERKKRRTQNDLRFQTLRKRVKIDPTLTTTIPAPPRPKKKSERISWLPTVEDGPTRSSSRRQTMVNKEMTHARLKDSQEKRVRIIATMKEAEKRKAHLKPKTMTQEDHLAVAERIERTNSKSLNRWEQAERRKADERRAKIEALQNRRLDGPVMSYWSGLATWVNGNLTRVGQAEIKAKEKEVPKKRKTEKEKEEKSEEIMVLIHKTPGVEAITDPSSTGIATASSAPVSVPDPAPAPAPALSTNQTSQSDGTSAPTASEVATAPAPNLTPTPNVAPEAVDQASKPDGKPNENPPDQISPKQSTIAPTDPAVNQEKEEKDADKKAESAQERENSNTPSDPPRKSPHGYPIPYVEIITRRDPRSTTPNVPSSDKPAKLPVTDEVDAMNMDKAEPKTGEPTTSQVNPPSTSTGTSTDTPAASETAQINTSSVPEPSSEQVTLQSATSATTPLAPQVPQTPQDPQAPLADAAALPAPPEINAIAGPGVPGLELPIQPPAANETPAQPEIPLPPPIIEYTGRNLTILENFDDKTAHSKKYSIYFNARRPARLSKISSSLCVITSLPSRYRDPETSLPYANSFAYGQIRSLISKGYIWSSMLGCFVGPAETAARGVPARFLGKEKGSDEHDKEPEKTPAESAEKTEPVKAAATSTDPMDVDR